MKRTAFILALALSISSGGAKAEDYKVGTIEISNPWARATPKGATVAGAYMKISNKGSAPDRLLDSPAVHGERFFLAEGADDHLPLMSGSIHGEADRMATGLRDRSMTVAVAHPPGGHAASAWYPAIPAAVDFLDTGWRPGPVR